MARYELFAYLNKEQDFDQFQGEYGSGRTAFLRADLESQRDYLIRASKERQQGKPRTATVDKAPWRRFTNAYADGDLVIAYDVKRGTAALFRNPTAASTDADKIVKEIQAVFKKYFPKSLIEVYFSANLAPSITVRFALGTKKDWTNGIMHNDPMLTVWHVGMGSTGYGKTQFDRDGNMLGDKVTIEMGGLGGSLMVGNHNYIKIPYRKQTVTPNKVVGHFERYLKKMRKTYEDNKDDVYVKGAGTRKTAAKYAEIVFLQNSQDFNGFRGSGGRGVDGFFDSDESEMMDYLMQWDDGEYHEVNSRKPWGTRDDTYKRGKYIMSYNSGLGYAGLCLMV